MIKFVTRLSGALALLPFAYEDIEADSKALPQAFAVVTLSSLATGAVYFLELGYEGALSGVVAAWIAWLAWSWLTFHIGVRWLPERQTDADWGQLLRVTGFATAPGLFRIAAIIPEAGAPVFWFTWVWMLAAFVMAVRQALDYESTWRAVLVCMAGAAVYAGVLFLLPRACQLG